jgi:hypothetical protein
MPPPLEQSWPIAPDGTTCPPWARADRADGRWYVRAVVEGEIATAVHAVRVIVYDRDGQRIVLHTLWTQWRDVPLLATLLDTVPASGTLAATAADLATALVAALRYDPSACLAQLGAPSES